MKLDTGSARNTPLGPMCSVCICIWHQIGERHYNKDFTKQGEEDRLLLFIQRLENGLSDILQIHENSVCGDGVFWLSSAIQPPKYL